MRHPGDTSYPFDSSEPVSPVLGSMAGPVRPARPVPRTSPLPGTRPPGAPSPSAPQHLAGEMSPTMPQAGHGSALPPLSAPLRAATAPMTDGGPAPTHGTAASSSALAARGVLNPRSRATPLPASYTPPSASSEPAPAPVRKPAAAEPADPNLPSWLRPFVVPTNLNTRFTRTPNYLLRQQQVAGVPDPDGSGEEPEATAAPVQPPQGMRPPPLIVPRAGPAARIARARSEAAAEPTPATEQATGSPVIQAAPPAATGAGAKETPATISRKEPSDSGPPANVRRIAELIRLDWDSPPVAPQRAQDAPAVVGLEEPVPATARARPADIRYSFAWPVFIAPSAIAAPLAAAAPEAAAEVSMEMDGPAVDDNLAPESAIEEPMAQEPVFEAADTFAEDEYDAEQAYEDERDEDATDEDDVDDASDIEELDVEDPLALAPARLAPTHIGQECEGYAFPPIELLADPPEVEPDFELSAEYLDRNSVKLQQVLHDFGVRGEIIDANPGPVVTLYELEPAPGIKSSRVTNLSADIARSMSAVSARVAVVEGRNVIGIELPNQRRETVWLREMLASHEFELAAAKAKLAIALGKTIGGEPVIVDLARMPHLLVAGTTGSGKSVAINTMILSLLYRHRPEQCRLIMIDPKMLELSVYEGIPHLLTPVVTDPKKAIIALKWAVKEMEDRYRKMSRLGVRNIDGFNARMAEARAKGEIITRTVQTGFDRETGQMMEEEEIMDLSALPYIVVVVDEMADLMMVAGKEIEGAIQRLAQMARAAGIHLIMATQRPSVDVITGTIKANFPTRISFQVTSKIDSRTILGEMGAEQLLGQGDMLYMAGGGRISRVHGPFVSDHEVEKVVAHLKRQGRPDYIEAVTADESEETEGIEDTAVFDKSAMGATSGEESGDLYDQAVGVVLRDRKASTSYIQRRLQIGYNRAASLMERMEKEGLVGPANHAGKREILAGGK
ncbi:DNA translocase FtsK [Ancylobacter sp. 6x-1]|uniref:DNA translocase FtsK n=1 Tax=Ancylobacter crimeensis TaxID=2579147 RepID=A0ABT0D8E7_9HYPH|nr:DNA translocase FtsK [Ancylobacter crimeensis]MCK0196233.1 DNA translocase FtsK [Ancylobacter crimeensis]